MPFGRKVSIEVLGDASSVERAFRQASVSATGFSRSVGAAEKEASRGFRGIAAGSGVFSGLGKSIAFASAGYLAFAGVAGTIRSSIEGAENLEKAQRGLDAAIKHTGGSLDVLKPKYEAIAKGAEQFGINQADATTELNRATVLTGDAAKAQRAYQEALVISKATGKDFNSVLTATAKGQEGITTSLQRYGIEIKKGTPGTQQFVTVMSRFAGQAKANTTESERFRAVLANTETIIGEALLPVVDKYLTKLSDWLEKMDRSGRLQKDVNRIMGDAKGILDALAGTIRTVDNVTGGLANTLKLLIALRIAFYLKSIAAGWDAVAISAGRAAGAQTAATSALTSGGGSAAAGEAGAAAGSVGLLGFLRGAGRRGPETDVVKRIKQYTSATNDATNASTKLATQSSKLGGAIKAIPYLAAIPILRQLGNTEQGFFRQHFGKPGGVISSLLDLGTPFGGADLAKRIFGGGSKDSPIPIYFQPQFTKAGGAIQAPGLGNIPGFTPRPGGGSPLPQGGPFPGATPISIWASFQLTIAEQVAQARAALTKTTKDDVAAAKGVIARIRRLIDAGHLQGNSLVQALQAEASALGTIQSAAQATAQKAAKAKAAALQAASTYNVPASLQLADARLQAFGKNEDAILHQIIAAAEKAIHSGKKNTQGLIAAYQTIASARSQLTAQAQTFTLPLRLQLQLARAQATGADQTSILKKMKDALERALKAAKGNIQKQIDIYNQIASINSQLANQSTAGLAHFKQANTRALTAGLNLTAAQRKALRARLSQLGPDGTVPNSGVGAYGYAITPDTGRPIHIHNHVHLDGKTVARSTTRHQQRHRRRNPSQRRGPNAATTG